MSRSLPPKFVADILKGLSVDVEEERGDELFALCPGHLRRTGKSDHNPSWSINTGSGIHHCFSCGFEGNLYSLVAEVNGKRAALEFWSDYKVHGAPVSKDFRVKRDRKFPSSFIVREHSSLPESWLAVYSSPPEWACDARKVSREACEDYGVHWEDPTDSWIFPLREPGTAILLGVQIKGQKSRRFRNDPPSMEKSLTFFGWNVVGHMDHVVVVESPLDAVRLWHLGYPALAVCGSSVSADQAELLKEFESIVLALDNDSAGKSEMRRIRKELTGVKIALFKYPPDSEGSDIGELKERDIDLALARTRVRD